MRIDKPADAEIATFDRFLLLRPRLDWTLNDVTYPAGSLLACDFETYLNGGRTLEMLFKPGPRTSLASFGTTFNYVILNVLENVRSRPALMRFTNDTWTRTGLDAPEFGNVSVTGEDPNESDACFMSVSDYLTPATLYRGVAGNA